MYEESIQVSIPITSIWLDYISMAKVFKPFKRWFLVIEDLDFFALNSFIKMLVTIGAAVELEIGEGKTNFLQIR